MSALFEEKKVQNEQKHAELDLKDDMANGESVGFYFNSTRVGTSAEYGDFTIVQGTKVDLAAKSIDAFVDSAEAVSFIPNTLLANKIEDGSFAEGECYRIEKAWDRGEKFKDGKVAKGYGYNLFHINIEPAVKKDLSNTYQSLINPLETGAGKEGKKDKKKKKKNK